MKRASFITLTIIGAYSALQAARAVDYPLPPEGSRLIGQNQTYTVQEGDKNLQAIARRFDTAAMLILEANNTIAPVPKPGTLITIPRRCYCRMRPWKALSSISRSYGCIITRREKTAYRCIPSASVCRDWKLPSWTPG